VIAFALLRPFLPYLIALAAMGGAYLWADEGWHNAVARRAEAKLAAIQQRADKARAAYAEVVRATEGDALRRKEHDDSAVSVLRGRVGNLSAVDGCYLSLPALGLLNDASRFANSADAAEHQPPGPAVPRVPLQPVQ
jgi:hypothetical protein